MSSMSQSLQTEYDNMHESDPIDVFMQLVFMIIIGYVAIDTLIKYAFF